VQLVTRAREAFIVAGACLFLYFTGLAEIPFYTRGEPREGLVVREMLRSGEWLVPARPDGEPARKPPLYYWSAAAARAALPDAPELALRLPSAAFATGAVLGTWRPRARSGVRRRPAAGSCSRRASVDARATSARVT
jgi:4-amino-4-deoxy-L-arabinose transferase-like glycosyltransferase